MKMILAISSSKEGSVIIEREVSFATENLPIAPYTLFKFKIRPGDDFTNIYNRS